MLSFPPPGVQPVSYFSIWSHTWAVKYKHTRVKLNRHISKLTWQIACQKSAAWQCHPIGYYLKAQTNTLVHFVSIFYLYFRNTEKGTCVQVIYVLNLDFAMNPISNRLENTDRIKKLPFSGWGGACCLGRRRLCQLPPVPLWPLGLLWPSDQTSCEAQRMVNLIPASAGCEEKDNEGNIQICIC